ncbi:MAG: hypothetical protein PHR35_16535, partial [Kiritimatiellae bacterium]|nr:hypothetical protein [Kiritimatiellia bacterium]
TNHNPALCDAPAIAGVSPKGARRITPGYGFSSPAQSRSAALRARPGVSASVLVVPAGAACVGGKRSVGGISPLPLKRSKEAGKPSLSLRSVGVGLRAECEGKRTGAAAGTERAERRGPVRSLGVPPPPAPDRTAPATTERATAGLTRGISGEHARRPQG